MKEVLLRHKLGCILTSELREALLRDDQPEGKMIVPHFTPEQLAEIEMPLRPLNTTGFWRMKNGRLVKED